MEFIEGTPPAGPRYDRAKIEAALRARPGEWAVIDEGPSALMHAYASRFRGTAGRRFECYARSIGYGTGVSRLYGRFVGSA